MSTEHVLELIDTIRINTPAWETFSTMSGDEYEGVTINDYVHSDKVDLDEDGSVEVYGSYIVALVNDSSSVKRILKVWKQINRDEQYDYEYTIATNVSSKADYEYAVIMQVGMFVQE